MQLEFSFSDSVGRQVSTHFTRRKGNLAFQRLCGAAKLKEANIPSRFNVGKDIDDSIFIRSADEWFEEDLMASMSSTPDPQGLLDWELSYTLTSGLFICGKESARRTRLAAVLLRNVIARTPLFGYFTTAEAYTELIKNGFDEDLSESGMDSEDCLRRFYLKHVWDVLVLDRLGEEFQSSWNAHAISKLVFNRFDYSNPEHREYRNFIPHLPTIITSKYSQKSLANMYGDDLGEAIESMRKVEL